MCSISLVNSQNNNIIHLKDENFSVSSGKPGLVLCTDMTDGHSLVLFHGKTCKFCQIVKPIFEKLSAENTENNFKFAMVDVGQEKIVVEKSKVTVMPLTHVPYIVYYVKGRPFMAYKGVCKEEQLIRFIDEAKNKIQTRVVHSQLREKAAVTIQRWWTPICYDLKRDCGKRMMEKGWKRICEYS